MPYWSIKTNRAFYYIFNTFISSHMRVYSFIMRKFARFFARRVSAHTWRLNKNKTISR